jgi:hypothetical protein
MTHPLRKIGGAFALAACAWGQSNAAPVLTVSESQVGAGGAVDVAWNGGSGAAGCYVYLSDATRTDYLVWAPAMAATGRIEGIVSTTALRMLCLDPTGAYLSPQPTAVVLVGNTRNCAVTNGIGTQTWTGSGWGSCQVRSCRSGYSAADNVCRSSSEPTLTVSSSQVAPGGTVMVAWNGGSAAHNCAVYLSDATRTHYQPWASIVSSYGVVAGITSTTVFDMTCIDASGEYLALHPSATVAVDPNPARASYLNQMSQLNLNRYWSWVTTFGPWEVFYDGTGTAVDGVPMSHAWDNPVDDDGLEYHNAGHGFRFDTPSPGFLTVDRLFDYDPSLQCEGSQCTPKGSVISKRDEFLRRDAGFTLEYRVKLFPDSHYRAFNAYYGMERESPQNAGTVIGIFLSPGALEAGGFRTPNATRPDPLDATSFNTFRIVQQPGQSDFNVYVNNSPVPLHAIGNSSPVSSLANHDDPYVIIGGESADKDELAHFTLDYVGYRRGAYPPGASMPAPRIRMPSPLPPSLPAQVQENFHPGLDGTFLPEVIQTGVPPPVFGRHVGTANGLTLLSGGTLDHNASETIEIKPVPGLVNKGDVTIEARIKVMSGSQSRSFSIIHSDHMGTVRLVFSPDKVETALGEKNFGYRDIGYQAKAMDTTDDFHVYRLVRQARQMYWHLYVDNSPVPAIVDQHVDGSTRGELFIGMGHAHRSGDNENEGRVLIDYVRWAPSAYAPPSP